MESFEVLQVSIKERILVVPFNFKRKNSGWKSFYVVNLMRHRLFLFTINNFFDFEIMLVPSTFDKSTPHALRELTLAATSSQNFLHGKLNIAQYAFDFSEGFRHVMNQNCLGMVQRKYLKAFV